MMLKGLTEVLFQDTEKWFWHVNSVVMLSWEAIRVEM